MDLFEALKNEPKYRVQQARRALFCDLIENWEQASVLPKELREKLNKEFPLDINAQVFEEKDTVKVLITLSDGQKIESVLMKHQDRNTVCVSCQVGCPLGCVFCATGKLGFTRNLASWEIIEQILFFARLIKNEEKSKNLIIDGRRLLCSKIDNVVFMGMGEPFLNYDNVLEAIKILNDKDGFNLGARHFSISTVGIAEGIEKLADENLQINLAISLHAPNDKLRSELMPINKKYNLKQVLESVDNYIKKTNRRVMLEYIMIKDVNDSDKCAKELAKIAKRKLCFVNLILYNKSGERSDPSPLFRPSEPARVKKFKEILEKSGVEVTQRYRFGEKMAAACGQLAGGVK